VTITTTEQLTVTWKPAWILLYSYIPP
jgi:hypothetical protein